MWPKKKPIYKNDDLGSKLEEEVATHSSTLA